MIKGKKASKETREKIRLSKLGSKNPMFKIGKKHPLYGVSPSKETREKIGKGNKGKKLSKETKLKMSLVRKGRKLSDEWKINIGRSNRGKNNGMFGKRPHNWLGGYSIRDYSFDFNEELKMIIRKRDNFKCQLCFSPAVIIHHIDYNKKNSNSNNLITLCRSCHAKTNNNRIYWEAYFNETMGSCATK